MDRSDSEDQARLRDEVKSCLAENRPLRGEEAELAFEQQLVPLRDRAIEASRVARAIPRDRAPDADK